jgi:uncharacterized protein
VTALITGASAGIGAELAKLFAKDGHDVLLIARRRERLEALALELAAPGKVRAHVFAADLSAPGAVASVVAECERLKLEIDFLVNNAGFGTSGAFAEHELARELSQVDLNVRALVELTRALLGPMLARKRGRILNLGSTAGFQPGPFMAVYYASKAFVNSFSEALAFELRGSGVTCTVSCPGATQTEFSLVAGTDQSKLFRMGAATAESVAAEAYRAMMKGKPMVVHGAKNKLAVQMLRVGPRKAILAIAASLNRKPA